MLALMVAKKKEDLPFYMIRDIPPSLFVAVNCFERDPQEFSHFFLSFAQLFSGPCKFFGIQLSLLIDTSCCYCKRYYK